MRGGKLLAEEPPAELIDFYQKDVKLYTLCFLTGAMVQSHIHATTTTATLPIQIFYVAASLLECTCSISRRKIQM